MGRKLILGGCLAAGTAMTAIVSICLQHCVTKKCFGCRCVNWSSSKYQISKNFNKLQLGGLATLLLRLITVVLTVDPDVFVWKLTTSGIFLRESMHAVIMNGHTIFLRKYI
jgi:hypothetical protein